MQKKYLSYTSAGRPSLLRKIVALAGTVVLASLALMFSAILLTALLIVTVIGGAYLWWKTRELRRQMREQMQNFPPRNAQAESDVFRGEVYSGEVIEGEVVRVHEPDDVGVKH
jgi:uncharacterized protein YneF (UPF0154 family)